MATLRAMSFVLMASFLIAAGGTQTNGALRTGPGAADGGPHSGIGGSPWTNVGTGDFNNDGSVDILWRHDDGTLKVWFMARTTRIGETFANPPAPADLAWRPRGTGDFNQDGKVDILWRHETEGKLMVWLMDGTTTTSEAFIDTSDVTDLNWRVQATGDFNQDGKVDILWRHQGSGQLSVWFMNGLTRTGGTVTTPESPGDLDWVPRATGDFDRDGKVDILWHHRTAGQVVIWYMNGTVMRDGTFTTPAEFDIAWELVGTGDFDGDGSVDIIWQGPPDEPAFPTGQNVVWLMGNAIRKDGGLVYLDPIN